jgi:hypothetical protein
MNTLILNESRSIIAPAKTRVDEIGQPMNIAVVDAGGDLAQPAKWYLTLSLLLKAILPHDVRHYRQPVTDPTYERPRPTASRWPSTESSSVP